MRIMNCVRTVRYMVKCNLSLSDEITLKQGLRQGDALSPYLFLFCMEALPRMLLKAQDDGKMRGIRVSQNGSRINHLFFTDDALLFVRNKLDDAVAIRDILHDKSMIYFSLNTPRNKRQQLSNVLGMSVVEAMKRYLGMSLIIG